MPALQVRDFPDELYEELRMYAAKNHRSIAQQTIACVENELARYRERERIHGAATSSASVGSLSDSQNAVMSANVRAASASAHEVSAFGWVSVFEIESDETKEERRARWRFLRTCFEGVREQWKGPKPTCEGIAKTIAEIRDERADSIIASVDGRAAASLGV